MLGVCTWGSTVYFVARRLQQEWEAKVVTSQNIILVGLRACVTAQAFLFRSCCGHAQGIRKFLEFLNGEIANGSVRTFKPSELVLVGDREEVSIAEPVVDVGMDALFLSFMVCVLIPRSSCARARARGPSATARAAGACAGSP